MTCRRHAATHPNLPMRMAAAGMHGMPRPFHAVKLLQEPTIVHLAGSVPQMMAGRWSKTAQPWTRISVAALCSSMMQASRTPLALRAREVGHVSTGHGGQVHLPPLQPQTMLQSQSLTAPAHLTHTSPWATTRAHRTQRTSLRRLQIHAHGPNETAGVLRQR